MIRRARGRRGLLIAGSVLVLALGLGAFWFPATPWSRTRARRAWLSASEAEVRAQLLKGRPAPPRPAPDDWLADSFALFDQGWAAWRLNSFHWDVAEGRDWTGIGDLVVLIDDQGRARYSRFHFCDGTLKWALGSPLGPPPPRPANLDAGCYAQ